MARLTENIFEQDQSSFVEAVIVDCPIGNSPDTEHDTACVSVPSMYSIVHGEKILEDVPIFYHCEANPSSHGRSLEGAATAFELGDQVILSTNPVAIVGFADGSLRPCKKKFYLRPTVDGRPLIHGGQVFFVKYINKDGDEITTESKSVKGFDVRHLIHGDPEKYYYCGPFELIKWDPTTSVKIYLKSNKNFSDMDPPELYDGEFWHLNHFFSYHLDHGSKKRVIKRTCDTHVSGEAPPSIYHWGVSCTDWSQPDQFMYISGRYCNVFSSIENSAEDRPWFGAYGFYTQIEVVENESYDSISALCREITPGHFENLLEHTEARIFNWDTEEYEFGQSVIKYNFDFGLKAVSKNAPLPVAHKYGSSIYSGFYFDCNENRIQISSHITPHGGMLVLCSADVMSVPQNTTGIDFVFGDTVGDFFIYTYYSPGSSMRNVTRPAHHESGVEYCNAYNFYTITTSNSLDARSYEPPCSYITVSNEFGDNTSSFNIEGSQSRSYSSTIANICGDEYCETCECHNIEEPDGYLTFSYKTIPLPSRYF